VQSCDGVVRALDSLAGVAATASPSQPAVVGAAAASVPPTNVRPLPSQSSARGIGMAVAVAILVGGVGVTAVLMLKPHGPAASDPQSVAHDPPPAKQDEARPQAARPEAPKTAAMAKPPSDDKTGPLRVAVAKFQNVGKDAELESLVQGIGETVIPDLAKVGGGRMKLLERSDLDSDIGELDRAKDEHFDKGSVPLSGNLEGVHVLVQGAFQRVGKGLRVSARFVRVSTGEILDAVRIDGRSRKAFEVQDEISKALQEHLLKLVDQERPAAAADKGTQ
jgi:TolB-like protein